MASVTVVITVLRVMKGSLNASLNYFPSLLSVTVITAFKGSELRGVWGSVSLVHVYLNMKAK